MKSVTRYAALFLACAAMSFAGPIGQAIQGLAMELVTVATWGGIIMCVICGIGLAAGGAHMVGKVGGLLLGLIFALFAQPIVTWVQSL